MHKLTEWRRLNRLASIQYAINPTASEALGFYTRGFCLLMKMAGFRRNCSELGLEGIAGLDYVRKTTLDLD